MPAYIVNQLTVHDTSYQAEYYPGVSSLLEKHGGRQIAGGPPVENLEGDWQLPERVAVLEFPTLEQAKAFWSAPEYEPFKSARQSCTTGKAMLIEGII